ncbi:hypothetical protein F5879DRAFT_917883 [Lentinula edodes]|nr:hypothetical protein F5879DRAFT_917883 [Lentinula edodes]
MRRTSQHIQKHLNKRQIRRISDADGNGYLYAYVDLKKWKIGSTNDFIRRQSEWNKGCPSNSRLWFPPLKVAHRRRAGQRKHIENFTFTQNWLVVWTTIVEPIMLEAAIL